MVVFVPSTHPPTWSVTVLPTGLVTIVKIVLLIILLIVVSPVTVVLDIAMKVVVFALPLAGLELGVKCLYVVTRILAKTTEHVM